MKLWQLNDGISPDLVRKANTVGDKRRHLQAMGDAVKSLSKRAFTDSSLRATSWPARKDDKPHLLLQKSTSLRKSIRVISVSSTKVVIGSDRKYAAIHQLGGKAGRGKKSKIPARPYLPFKNGRITARGNVAVTRALTASLKSSGL